MDVPIQELMAQIGEMSVESRALNQALNNAVARINFLEHVCQRNEIDLDEEAKLMEAEAQKAAEAETAAQSAPTNGGQRHASAAGAAGKKRARQR